MYWFPYLWDTDSNVLYEVDNNGIAQYAGIYPEWKRADVDEACWAIKKFYYDWDGNPTGREWVWGKKNMNYVRNDRASYFI